MRFLYLMFANIVFVSVAIANDVGMNAELYWVQKDNSMYHIMFSEFSVDLEVETQQWSEPRSIYQSDNFLSGATVVSTHNGDKMLVWSEHQRLKSVLKLMSYRAGQWSTDKLLSRFGKENLGAAAIIDINKTMWVFWAATKENLSDIYFIRSKGASWSEPELLHSANKVPDYLPQLVNTKEGNIEVSWYSYSFLLTDYSLAKQIIELDPEPKVGYKAEILGSEQNLSDVTTPSFAPSDTAVLLHFPSNQLKQNYLLQDN